MIKNFNLLANTEVKKKALKILEVGLTAAQPKNFLKTFFKKNYILLGKNRIFLSNYGKIFVIAYGKAADSMAEYVSKKINVSQGIVVVPKCTKLSLDSKKFKVFYSDHPLPDKESVRAGKAVQKFVNNCSKGDFILFLVSGGGSSLLALPDKITLTEKKHATKLLLQCGAAIDENIGKLLDYLDKTGLAENTVVIYTADQGYFLGEHGFFDKRLIYEESLRMPFVIRYPREIPAGTRNSDIVLNIDFSALMADYAGIQIQNTIQGTSFRNNLIGYTPTDWRKSMYYRYWLHRIERPGHFGLRNKRFKLVFFYGQPLGMKGAMKTVTNPAWEFYDLKKDPQENHNAYQDGEYADIIKTMKTELLIQRKIIGDMDKEYPIMQDIIDKYWD